MDVITAIRERRSCRMFLSDPVNDEDVEKIIDAATQAPSPFNGQPWKFVVVSNNACKEAIYNEAVRYKQELLEKSGWKWLEKYELEYVKSVPVMIVVCGNPKKSGADTIMEGESYAWRDACAVAIQNMMLAAEAEDLSTLWFTMYNKDILKNIIECNKALVPVAIVFVGKEAAPSPALPRKSIEDVINYIK